MKKHLITAGSIVTVFILLAIFAAQGPMGDNLIAWGIFLAYAFVGQGYLKRDTKKEKRQNNRLLNITIGVVIALLLFFIFISFLPDGRMDHLKNARWSILAGSFFLYLLAGVGIGTTDEDEERRRKGLPDSRFMWANTTLWVVLIAIVSKLLAGLLPTNTVATLYYVSGNIIMYILYSSLFRLKIEGWKKMVASTLIVWFVVVPLIISQSLVELSSVVPWWILLMGLAIWVIIVIRKITSNARVEPS